jgi:hypothetical protein
MTAIDGWENFYLIIGSSAAALTGLMFVVITLTAENREEDATGAMDAFASPTVLHFCAVLLVAAILTTPGHTTASLSFSLGVCGVGGIVYSAQIIVRMRRLMRGNSTYTPVRSDLIWHCLLPLIAYMCLLGAAAVVWASAEAALYSVAAGALLLLYIGIHNAWDAATWMAVHRKK